MGKMKRVNLYVMTSIRRTVKLDGMGLWVLEWIREDKDPVTKTGEVPLKGVNRMEAELLTLIAALEKIKEPVKLQIFLNDTQVTSAINNLLPGWINSGFMRSDGAPIAHEDEWKMVHKYTKKHGVLSVSKENHEFHSWMKDEIRRKASIPAS